MVKKVCKLIKYIFIVIVFIFVVSGVVYATTSLLSSDTYYDNTSSGLSSTNVQDALDELYNKANNLAMVGVDGLAKNITDLYIDADKTTVTNNSIDYNYATSVKLMNDRHGGITSSLDGGNIRYYGANPDNYIYFNCDDYSNQLSSTCELWRIVGVFDGKVKIVRNDSIGTYSWDYNYNDDLSSTNYTNDWKDASLRLLLNNFYYNNVDTVYYNGWNDAGGGTYTINANFATDKIGIKNDETKNMISESVWYFGKSSTNDLFSNSLYGIDHAYGNSLVNNIGLLYPSDFGYAVSFDECSLSVSSYYYYDFCDDNNWISKMFYHQNDTTNSNWLLMGYSENNIRSFFVTSSGEFHYTAVVAGDYYVYPTLYLNLNVSKKNGDGSVDNPYQILVS